MVSSGANRLGDARHDSERKGQVERGAKCTGSKTWKCVGGGGEEL